MRTVKFEETNLETLIKECQKEAIIVDYKGTKSVFMTSSEIEEFCLWRKQRLAKNKEVLQAMEKLGTEAEKNGITEFKLDEVLKKVNP